MKKISIALILVWLCAISISCLQENDDSSNDDNDDTPFCSEAHPDNTVGLQLCKAGVSVGYTLFAPLPQPTTYLIDMFGQIVHQWDHPLRLAYSVYLLEDGRLLRTARTSEPTLDNPGGEGGLIRIYDWDSNLLWEYEIDDERHLSHHDIEMLPNGNILILAWDKKTSEEAVKAGRDPSTMCDDSLWFEYLVEVEPAHPKGGNIVWEWRCMDHLIQEYNAEIDNFGAVNEHPELININYFTGMEKDWLHINAVDYNEELDQIVLSVRNLNEIWIIDHSTTSEEAAGHSGGNSGKGGDLLYRGGNPSAYGSSVPEEVSFIGQHDSSWIEPGFPGEGNMIVFNNGHGLAVSGENYSSVVEFSLPVSKDGEYEMRNPNTYKPFDLIWIYTADNPEDFSSPSLSGVTRLPNGNTLVCSGVEGRIFELTNSNEIVWEYISPVTRQGPLTQGDSLKNADNYLFRAYRYPPDYPAFENKDLSPKGTVENPRS